MDDLFLFVGRPGQNQQLEPLACESLSISILAGPMPALTIRAVPTAASMLRLKELSEECGGRSLVAVRVTRYDTLEILLDCDVCMDDFLRLMPTHECGRPVGPFTDGDHRGSKRP